MPETCLLRCNLQKEVAPLTSGRLSHSSGPHNGGGNSLSNTRWWIWSSAGLEAGCRDAVSTVLFFGFVIGDARLVARVGLVGNARCAGAPVSDLIITRDASPFFLNAGLSFGLFT
jgi:hypothetical protein